MSAARHAGQILEAWQMADNRRFKSELENAWILCKTQMPASSLEAENQELLESIVEHLRSVPLVEARSAQHLEADFALLQHLQTRPDCLHRTHAN
jgi:hypothetical protein